MKENVLDVLMYLFENYIYDEPDTPPDQDQMRDSLLEVGFSAAQIHKAFCWLKELSDHRSRPPVEQTSRQFRVYSPEELARLDTQCRGFLQYLEDAEILDSQHRELVIDRVMALETDSLDIDDMKWIILMVLFNQPGQEEAYAQMENLVYDEFSELLH